MFWHFQPNVVSLHSLLRKNKQLSLIHHSDRGLQYCADDYQKLLIKNKIQCSMTQNSDPYENAVAERVNGILKQEFMIDKYNQSLVTMKQIVKEAIDIYISILKKLN